MDPDKIMKHYAKRVGWSDDDLAKLGADDVRRRHITNIAPVSGKYSIVAQITKAEHCNSGYEPGTRLVLDVDGNFISKLCPGRICVYLASQLVVPVAVINERLSEGLDPQPFHFCHTIRCPDMGVDCGGYGQVEAQVTVETRNQAGAN